MIDHDPHIAAKFRFTTRAERRELLRAALVATSNPAEVADWVATIAGWMREHRKVDSESILELAAAAVETFRSFEIPIDLGPTRGGQ